MHCLGDTILLARTPIIRLWAQEMSEVFLCVKYRSLASQHTMSALHALTFPPSITTCSCGFNSPSPYLNLPVLADQELGKRVEFGLDQSHGWLDPTTSLAFMPMFVVRTF